MGAGASDGAGVLFSSRLVSRACCSCLTRGHATSSSSSPIANGTTCPTSAGNRAPTPAWEGEPGERGKGTSLGAGEEAREGESLSKTQWNEETQFT